MDWIGLMGPQDLTVALVGVCTVYIHINHKLVCLLYCTVLCCGAAMSAVDAPEVKCSYK